MDADAAGGAERGRGRAALAKAGDPPSAPPQATAAAVAAAVETPRAVMRQLSPARVAIVGLFVFAVVGVLALGRTFFVPLVGAIVLAMVLAPLVARLESLHVPRTAAALAAVAFLVLTLFVAVDLLLDPLARLLDTLPSMQALLSRATRLARNLFGEPYGNWIKARFAEFAAQQSGTLSSGLFAQAAGASVGIGTVLLLAFFLLASGDHFLQKLVQALPRIRDKVKAVQIVRTVQEEVSHYFVTVTLINLVLGTVIGLVCWYFDMPNALLWGAVVALFNFVPYIGPMASFTLISIASAANFLTISEALVVPLLFAVITLVEGQVLTPMIVGRRVALNPVVVFVSLMFWAWLWGVAGMILAVPMMLVAKIWSQRTESLASWSAFLGPNERNGNGKS
jgi:predicted PurR-regulated permease PerM